MSWIQGSTGTVFGQYNFAVSGGVVGVFDLGVTIPQFSLITEFVVFPIVTATSGGLATISFGLIDNSVSPSVDHVGALLTATAVASFVKWAAIVGIDPTGSFGASTISGAHDEAVNISMAIAVADLTAGNLQFYCKYTSFEFSS